MVLLNKAMSHLLSLIRFILFLVMTLFWVLIQIPVYLLTKNHTFIPRQFHRSWCWLMNVNVRVMGQKGDGRALFLSNHISWADIPVLGAHIKASFVAKSDVAGWPGFGALARIQNTLFIDRRREAVEEANAVLSRALDTGESLILFPEGTNTVGDRVLPFKSSLLGAAQGREIAVQPVCIKVEGGLERYGWGDVDFVPHFWAFLGRWRYNVELHFMQPIDVKNLSRKEIARLAEESVRNRYHESK